MIHWLRTWRQASPAVVRREPGYWTKGWISTPCSAPGKLLMPFCTPESCTARQKGALLPGWLFERWALLSSACGSAGATNAAAEAAIAGLAEVCASTNGIARLIAKQASNLAV